MIARHATVTTGFGARRLIEYFLGAHGVQILYVLKISFLTGHMHKSPLLDGCR